MKRLAVICDLVEENWPSMDLAGAMLLKNADQALGLEAIRICPPMRRRLTRLPFFGGRRAAENTDRLLNRFWDYPRHLRRRLEGFDFFHVSDHSYAQLVHELPAGRAGVFCHDLDTFRCLLDPVQEPRSASFRMMARRVLRGMQKAAVVFHTTAAVRRQIERHGILDPSRLVHAPNGVLPVYTPEPSPHEPASQSLGSGGGPYLLHVGSCIPRKRIDVLLKVFTAVKARHPGLRLVQVGGSWTGEQRALMGGLNAAGQIVQISRIPAETLAGLYRRAALVLLTSELEGFGFPVAEALACGAVVVASDLESVREVGGEAVVYCPVADLPAWVEAVDRLLRDPGSAPPLQARLGQARRFSWPEHARIILDAYRRLS